MTTNNSNYFAHNEEINDAAWANLQADKLNYKIVDVKGIFLDLDGTLLDTKSAYIEAANITFKSLGLNPLENLKYLEIPKRIEQRLPFTDLVKTEPKKFLNEYLKSFYSVAYTKTRPILNAASTLRYLSKKAKLSLITMRFVPKAVIIEELNRFGMAQYFSDIITAFDTYNPKPSPESLFRTVKTLDVNINKCIMVGDSVIDVQAGNAAGIKSVAVLSGLYSKLELSKVSPFCVINNVSELPFLIA